MLFASFDHTQSGGWIFFCGCVCVFASAGVGFGRGSSYIRVHRAMNTPRRMRAVKYCTHIGYHIKIRWRYCRRRPLRFGHASRNHRFFSGSFLFCSIGKRAHISFSFRTIESRTHRVCTIIVRAVLFSSLETSLARIFLCVFNQKLRSIYNIYYYFPVYTRTSAIFRRFIVSCSLVSW